MRFAFSFALAIATASLCLAACGITRSTGFEPVDGAASMRDASATDAATDDALLFGSDVPLTFDCGAPAPACPPAAPEAGSLCQTAVDCEYGDDPQPSCNTIASCSGSRWEIVDPIRPVACPSALAPGCPGSYTNATALVASGAACDASVPKCVYPEGTCDCPNLAGQTHTWRCSHPGPGCPSTRPRYGSACDAGGSFLSCGYGGGCYDLPMFVSSSVACICGAWQGYPACQFP